MTKTEAADVIATDVRVFARKHGTKINRSLVDERLSELVGDAYKGTVKGDAAAIANWRTVLRQAIR